MAFSYSAASLTAGGTAQAVAEIRIAIGDTVSGSGVLPSGANFDDAEILYFYTNEGGVVGATAGAAETLARTFSRLVDTTAGPLSKSYSQASKQWAALAATLRDQTGTGYATFRTGISRQDGYAYRAGTVDVNP